MKVLLHNKELWEKFREHQTEMMVTKEGRRMCPAISLAFEDLKPKRMYAVMIDFVYADEFRYCFDMSSNLWTPWREVKEEEGPPRMYLHPETPTTGALLMKSVLTFQKIKLTNSEQTAEKPIQVFLLNTMRRYVPRIHLLESPDGASFFYETRKEFCFPETEFIAVSAYRNKQITKLKIDANPFASAYRSSGLHGQAQAKRRRVEGSRNRASKEWEASLSDECDPPSNRSSLDESLNNNRGEHEPGKNSSSNELLNRPLPKLNYDEQQLSGIQAAIPFLKDRLRRDVAFFVYNPIYNGVRNQERVANLEQATKSPPTYQSAGIRENESQLACEETTEWMWGFDEQMTLRYSPEYPELESFLPKQGYNAASFANNLNKANDEHKQAGNAVSGTKKEDEDCDAVKVTVNRRKKYLPRKLQRTSDVPLTEASSKANGEKHDLQQEQPSTSYSDLLSSQSQGTKCNEQDNTERLSSAVATPQDASKSTSPCKQTDIETPSSHEMATSQDQGSVVRSFQTIAGLSVANQDGANLPSKESDASSTVVDDGSSMLLSSRQENAADSSLTALIKMCSETEGPLGNTSFLPWSKQEEEMLSTISSFSQLPFSQRSLTAASLSSFIHVASLDGRISEPPSSSDADELSTQFSEDDERTDPPLTPMTPSERVTPSEHVTLGERVTPSEHVAPSERVTSSSVHNTSLSVPVVKSAAVSCSGMNALRNKILEKLPKTTDQSQTSSSVIASEKSGAVNPVLVDSISSLVTFSESSGRELQNNKNPGYRPIIPTPTQPVDIISEAVIDASFDSGYSNDDPSYPIILNTFSITDNMPSALAQHGIMGQSVEMEKEVCSSNSHFTYSEISPPNFYQTDLTGHFGYIALDSTIALQDLSLEKFYSFPSPYKREHETRRSRLYGTRHYKTTRTNFSRLSLEPLCSVIYPMTSYTRQSSGNGKEI